MTAQPVLRITDLAKRFGSVAALGGVTMEFFGGRVHTLLGENGAGKSTLIKIISGLYAPTSGSMQLSGQPYAPRSPVDARDAGVSTIFQELSLSNNLSVAENIYAVREPARLGFISTRRLFADAECLLAELGFRLNPRARVGDLSLAQRQLVEIAKGLRQPARVVVLDEPTSSLSDSEAEQLFRVIEKMRAAGTAIIYISHRMDELMRVSDEITVMRDGAYVSTTRRDAARIDALIALMVGRRLQDVFPPRLSVPPSVETTPSLEARNLSGPGFNNVGFAVRPGEVLGFFGLIGAGRSEVMRALFGMLPSKGSLLIDGKPVRMRHPSDAIARGIAFVTENRKEEGLVLRHNVMRNIVAVRHVSTAHSWGLARSSAELETANAEVRRLRIKTGSLSTPVTTLSGGNQQKVVLGKWLAMAPRILILDEPTRGIDVGAKFELYRVIRTLAAEGTAILLVSSELAEVLGLSDRVVIMHGGKVAADLPQANLTRELVMKYAAGVRAEPELSAIGGMA